MEFRLPETFKNVRDAKLSDKVVSMHSVRRSVLNFEHHHERANSDPTCHQHGFASAVHLEFCPTVVGALDSVRISVNASLEVL